MAPGKKATLPPGTAPRERREADTHSEDVIKILHTHKDEQRIDVIAGDNDTIESLRCLEAQADIDSCCTEEERVLEELEAKAMAPRLQTLAYLPPEEVAQRLLRVLRLMTSQSSEASTARAAELRALMWAHEWLALQPSARIAFTRRLVQGIACLEASEQAQHLEFIAELRLARWEPPEECHVVRVARGLRIGRASAVVLLALRKEELDAIGKVYADTLSHHLTHCGAAKAVVRMSPTSRRQLAKVFVYEEILTQEASDKLFKTIKCVIGALGADKLETTLTGLDTAVSVGGGALSIGGYALGTLGSLGSDALGTMSTVSSGFVHAMGSTAAAGAGATASLLYSPSWALSDRDSRASSPLHAADFI